MSDEMIIFANHVKAMRSAQREYFRNRTPATLKAAKDCEAMVDGLVTRILDSQPSLF